MTSATAESVAQTPFIGLRRFEIDDSHLFFGRGEQTHDLLRRLRMLHFVAVVGPSGCGKSSLIRAGVLAALRDGYLLGDEETEWQIVETQPGNGPLQAWERDLQKVKRASAASADLIIDPVRAIDTTQGPVVILVDQFEELFQFADRTGKEADVGRFIDAIIAAGAAGEKIFTILTMRSEYLARCAQYPLLAEAINEGLYLVPQMRREQLYEAIVKPVHQTGGAITTELVDRLLDDVSGERDSLPILQHALMRMWPAKRQWEPLGLYAYDTERGLSAFITDHAEHVYESLTADEKKACEAIFRTITELTSEGRTVRRATELNKISERTGFSEAVLETVARRFEKEGFLVLILSPDSGSPLVDITHEAVARQWGRLGPGYRENGQFHEGWVTKEARFRQSVRSVQDAARSYEDSRRDKAFLYRGLQLTVAEEAVRRRESELSAAGRTFLAESRKRENRMWWVSAKVVVPALIIFAILCVLAYTAFNARLAAQQASAARVRAELVAAAQLEVERKNAQDAVSEVLSERIPERATVPPTTTGVPVAPRAIRPRIYIQIREDSQMETARAIAQALRADANHKFIVPGIERLPVGPRRTEVRYFSADDREQYGTGISAALDSLSIGHASVLVTPRPGAKIRQKHLELWLAPPEAATKKSMP